MRHATLKKRAEIVDLIIDHYNRVRRRKNFPKKIVADVVGLMGGRAEIEEGRTRTLSTLDSLPTRTADSGARCEVARC